MYPILSKTPTRKQNDISSRSMDDSGKVSTLEGLTVSDMETEQQQL